MAEQTFEVRSTEIDKTTLYEIDETGFSWKSEKGAGRFAWGDIAAVHVMAFESQYGRGRLCRLKSKTGRKKVFRSLHCRGLGDFEDRTEGYAAFVGALLRNVAEKAPEAKITRGSSFDYIALMIGLLILVGAGLVFLIAVLGGGLEPDPSLLGFAAFIVFMIPVAWRFMQRRRPGTFDPANPPQGLLSDTDPPVGGAAGTN